MPIEVTNNQPTKETAEPVKADPVVEVVAEKTPATEETQAETLEASGAANETAIQPEEKEKPSKGVQKRFDALTKQREDAKRETEFWKAEALKAKAIPEKPPEAQTTAPVAAAGEPDPDKFESHGLYLKALTRWEIAQERQALEVKATEAKTLSEQKQQVDSHVDRVLKFKEATADFDQAIEAVDHIIMPPLLQREIVKSEDSARLMYELSKNPEELARICGLPEDKIVRALGRFEAKFEPQATAATSEEIVEKPASKAPPPINPVGNKGTGAGKKSLSDPNLSQKEFEAIVREQAKGRAASW